MSAGKVERLRAQLEKACAELDKVSQITRTADARADAHTINDPGAISGIRRKANPRADTRRYNAYAVAAAAQRRLDQARDDVTVISRQLAAAEAEAERVPFTAQDLAGAIAVRDKNGWHKVVKVNAKSVTVETGYSWTDRIPLERILQVHKGGVA